MPQHMRTMEGIPRVRGEQAKNAYRPDQQRCAGNGISDPLLPGSEKEAKQAMKRTVTMTVIRGNGECEAIVNGVVNQELRKLRERDKANLRTCEANLEVTRQSRNRMLANQLKALEHALSKRRTLRRVATAWAVFYATLLMIRRKELR